MNPPFQTELAGSNAATREALYRGTLFLITANEASRQLVATVREQLENELGRPVREAQFRMTGDEFFHRVGRLRRRFYTADEYHRAVGEVIQSLAFPATEHAFDPIRLRVVTHRGHDHAAAQPVYYGHRDTWYSNPQAMVTWWIPLHDVEPAETFEFFPEYFGRPVRNDSEVFDFDEWVADGQSKRIGWQDRETGLTARYPQLLEPTPPQGVPVHCRAGDVLLFSAQHLHQTRKNMTGRTRFSIDFRTVHLGDHAAGIGPANVDNRSTGSSLCQFVRPVPESVSAKKSS